MNPPIAEAHIPTGPAVAGWLGLFFGAAAAAVLLVSVLYDPAAIEAGQHLADLGIPRKPCAGCPLCGLSRGFSWMSAGQPAAAISLNPLVALVYPLAWLVALGGPVLFVRQRLRRS